MNNAKGSRLGDEGEEENAAQRRQRERKATKRRLHVEYRDWVTSYLSTHQATKDRAFREWAKPFLEVSDVEAALTKAFDLGADPQELVHPFGRSPA